MSAVPTLESIPKDVPNPRGVAGRFLKPLILHGPNPPHFNALVFTELLSGSVGCPFLLVMIEFNHVVLLFYLPGPYIIRYRPFKSGKTSDYVSNLHISYKSASSQSKMVTPKGPEQ